MEKLIKRGSEADIFLGKYYGKDAILKIRKERKYRQPTLDKRLRKRRTINEATIVGESKDSNLTIEVGDTFIVVNGPVNAPDPIVSVIKLT